MAGSDRDLAWKAGLNQQEANIHNSITNGSKDVEANANAYAEIMTKRLNDKMDPKDREKMEDLQHKMETIREFGT